MQRTPHSSRLAFLLVPYVLAGAGCTILVNNELDGKPASLADLLDAGTNDADGSDRPPSEDASTPAPDANTPAQDSSTPPAVGNAGYSIVMGGAHGCALSPAGEATCWGDDTDGQLKLPKNTYSELAAGDGHTCGITSVGALVCVGRNTSAQRASAPGPFVHVAAGDLHTCALASTGQVTCYGDKTEGQTTPPADVQFSQIAAGRAFTCGIETSSSHLRCWGRGKTTFENSAVNLALRAISAGDGVVCGIVDADGRAKCWGTNAYATPVADPVKVISVGVQECAVLETGSIGCWGVVEPVTFDDASGPYLSVAAGGNAICALPENGSLICHGGDGVSAAAPPPNYP